MSNGSNMSLEDILQELTKYGRPVLNQYAVTASRGTPKMGGSWGCEVSIPSTYIENPKRDLLKIPVTGWRMWGKGSMRDAAEDCLRQCIELAESDLAPYAKFVSEEAVRGK